MTATFVRSLRGLGVGLGVGLGRARSTRPNSTGPTVSVVVNTLNRRDHLERTLLALRDQTYASFEVVVVDGPSVDGTGTMLRQFADRARLASCAQACLGTSRNVGVELAAGEIVVFIDDDAIPPTNWLELLVEPYVDDDVAAVGGPVFDVPNGRIDWHLCVCDRLGGPAFAADGPPDRYLGRGADPFMYLAGCNMSFRKSALHAVGGFNSLLAYGYDDVEVCSRIVDHGFRIALVDDAVVRHERAPSSVRDEHQVVRNPYTSVYSRAVFALQVPVSPHTTNDVQAMLQSWMHDWHNTAQHHIATGLFDAAQAASFVERARLGAVEGLAAGMGDRPWRSFHPQPSTAFSPYR